MTRFLPPILAVALLALVLAFIGAGLRPTIPLPAVCVTPECKEGREWLAFALTVAIVIGGLYQYWQAQRWKRAEWVAETTKAFFEDRKVRSALYMLDWNARRLPLLLEAPTSRRSYFDYEAAMLETAFYSKTTIPRDAEGERPFSENELAIRDCFDHLLDQLERFEVFINSGLVTHKELKPYLHYWFQLIGDPNYGRKEAHLIHRLWSFIDDYGFAGVQRMAARFGYDIRPPREIVRDAYGSPHESVESSDHGDVASEEVAKS